MHLRKAFRPRPIDVERPMPIIKHEIDSSDVRFLPDVGTGMEHEEEEEIHLQAALRSVEFGDTEEQKKAVTIPTPSVAQVGDYENVYTQRFHAPKTYVQFTPVPEIDAVDYDVDEEDDAWISAQREQGRKIDEDAFEFVMDRMEKEQGPEEGGINVTLQRVQDLIDRSRRYSLAHDTVAAIHQYWSKKRLAWGKPIIVRLRKPPDHDDPSPYLPFRPREKESNRESIRTSDAFCMEKMRQLRNELDVARELLEMVCNREKKKKKTIELSREIFSLRCIERPADEQPKRQKTVTKRPPAKKKKREAPSAEVRARPVRPASTASVDVLNELLCLSELSITGESHRSTTKRKRPATQGVCYTNGPTFDPYPPHADAYRWIDTAKAECDLSWRVVEFGHAGSFRGRARVGRGGRMFVDRMPVDAHVPQRVEAAMSNARGGSGARRGRDNAGD